MTFFKPLLIVLAFYGMTSTILANDTQSRSLQLVQEVIEAIDEAEAYTYELVSYERVNGEIEYDRIRFAIEVEPYRVMLNCLEKPHKGVRIYFNEKTDPEKARVNPGMFLPIVKLDPYGKKMRKNNHHSVRDAGFQLIRNQLASYITKGTIYSENSATSLKYGGEIEFNGILCEKLIIEHDDFDFVPYTVKNGETLYQIAHRMHVSEFLIRNHNESLQDWDSQVGPGEKIFIPNYYSKKTVLYIDKRNKHPIYQEMFDEKGMFEKYLFLDLSINPKLGDSDFAI